MSGKERRYSAFPWLCSAMSSLTDGDGDLSQKSRPAYDDAIFLASASCNLRMPTLAETSESTELVLHQREPKTLGGQLKASWWMGLVLAIPLSIVANLLTPPIQEWLTTKSNTASVRRLHEVERETSRIAAFHKDKLSLTNYLLLAITKSGLYLALVMILNHFLGLLMMYIYSSKTYKTGDIKVMEVSLNVARTLHGLIAIFGLILILNLCKEAVSTYTKVHNFEQYQLEVQEEIQRLRGLK